MIDHASHLPLQPFSVPGHSSGGPASKDQETLRKAAIEFEAIFLQELLKIAHPKDTQGMFGGGEGEEMFMDQLTQERARAIATNGGLGIAKIIEDELSQDFLKPSAPRADKEHVQTLNQKLRFKSGMKTYEEHSRSSLAD